MVKVFEIDQIQRDDLATQIGMRWYEYDTNRAEWKKQKKELRSYIVATDTSHTPNASLPWRHKTTIPKLTQIRDNLHAQYMSALFPNDDWLRWEAHSEDGLNKEKKAAIEFYMKNKLRRNQFRSFVSELVYDYIDYGNVFCECDYEITTRPGESIPQVLWQGPVPKRVSPLDIVFDPTCTDFYKGWVITREVKTLGDLKKDTQSYVGNKRKAAEKAYKRMRENRRAVFGAQGKASFQDLDKLSGVTIDGFGSYSTYLMSDFCEILTFRGDWYNKHTDQLEVDRVITVIDRAIIVDNVQNDTWTGHKGVVRGVWRRRPDNLWGMGPLDNLVGMQYKIDHLENIKADMFDLIAMPPVKIKGHVENFSWQPLAEIYLGEDSDVEMLQLDARVLQAETQIQIIEQKMEEYAGAPRQAVGQRTPGEKTAFEIQVLENNSNKMFSEKSIQFEIEVLEPLMNNMLEQARRNLQGADLISTMDDEFGVKAFIQITRQDLSTEGKIVPIGARHFLARNLAIQNYIGLRNAIGADPAVMAHISGIKEAKMFEDLLGLEKYQLVRENVRVEESMQTAQIQMEAQRALQEQQLTPATELERDLG